MQLEFEGNPLTLKKILSSLFKYRWINLAIIFTTIGIGILIYYRSYPVYESTVTIEISSNPQDNRVDFFGNQAGKFHRIETEIDILKSEFLLRKTLHSVDLGIEYIKTKNFKSRKLYGDSPFTIEDLDIKEDKAYEKIFNIKYIDRDRYELSIKSTILSELLNLLPERFVPVKYKIPKRVIYRYKERVILDDCSFIVNKSGVYDRAEYNFKFNTYDNVIKSIRENLTIKPASFHSSVLKVSYKDNISKRAKDFLNSYIQNYLLYSERTLAEMNAKTLKFINEQLDMISKKLQSSENQLQGYKSSNNISDIETQKIDMSRDLSDLTNRLNEAKIEFNIVKRLYEETKKGNYNIISSISREYPVLNTMLRNLEDTKLEIERKLSTFTENHPDIKSLQSAVDNIQNAILDISKGILDSSKERLISLEKVVNEYILQLKKFPEIEKELVKRERIYAVNDRVYNYLLTKQSELSIEKASTVLDKKVLDFAKSSPKPLSPNLNLTIAVSTFLGLVLALLYSYLRTKFDTKIKDIYDIHKLTDIPIFGTIPFVKRENYNSAYVLDEPNSFVSEAFRNIKNNLEYIVTQKRCKVILVTSTVPNEGKTTISANLASVLGMGDKKSIILSLDLRRPEIHHKFSLSNKVGMSDLLSNKVDLNEVIWENENFRNLHIITSGRVPPNPAELLASSRMKELIDKLSLEYDYIILDTPPFEYVSDALSLIKYADITLFVLKSEFSEDKYLKEIDKIVKRVGIENSGIILNSVKAKYYSSRKFDYKYIYHEA